MSSTFISHHSSPPKLPYTYLNSLYEPSSLTVSLLIYIYIYIYIDIYMCVCVCVCVCVWVGVCVCERESEREWERERESVCLSVCICVGYFYSSSDCHFFFAVDLSLGIISIYSLRVLYSLFFFLLTFFFCNFVKTAMKLKNLASSNFKSLCRQSFVFFSVIIY